MLIRTPCRSRAVGTGHACQPWACHAAPIAFRYAAGHAAIFNHHDPLGSAADLAYFERCAVRFEAVLRAPGHVLFLLVTREPASAALAPLHALLVALCSRTSNFEILTVRLACHAAEA